MSMLLTGQVQVRNEGRVFPSQEPLSVLLRERGYRTGAVVANQLLTAERGFDRGFDDYQVHVKPDEGISLGWLGSEVTARGIEFLERGREPFFLMLHYFDPHGPYRPTDGVAFDVPDDPARMQFFREALSPEKRDLLTHEDYRAIEHMIARYDSEVLQVDRAIGDLFDWMEREGLLEDTLVVFTSDHGEALWQREVTVGEKVEGRVFPHLYFEHGIQLYEEAVRVPLVLRGPGVPAGARDDAPVSLLDVVPTVLALLDVPPPPLLFGRPLFGAGAGDAPDVEPRPIYAICSRGQTVTVDGRYRYHRWNDYKVEQGAVPELFDLATDPLERRPLDDPARAASMRAMVEGWVEAHAAVDWGESEPLDREALEREFAKIGYAVDEMIGEQPEELLGRESPESPESPEEAAPAEDAGDGVDSRPD
jgi:arylsulfatase A-like enzyme